MSKSYKTLWNELTRNAIIPAIKNIKSKSGGKKSTRHQISNRNNYKLQNNSFIQEWTQPLQNIRKKVKNSPQKGGFIRGGSIQNWPCVLDSNVSAQNGGRKKLKRSQSKKRRKSSAQRRNSQRGGFIRGGSIQNFPCTQV